MTLSIEHQEQTVTISIPDEAWQGADGALNAGGDLGMAEWLVGRIFQAGEGMILAGVRSQVVISAG